MLEIGKNAASDRVASKHESFVVETVVFGFTIGMIWLLEAIGWLQGGGLSSLLAASRELRSGSLFIDVDESALRAPIMTLLAISDWLVVICFHLKLRARWWGGVLALVVFGGGFVIDGIFEPQLARNVMAVHGYSRCRSRDHGVGHGKSLISFNDYVRLEDACSVGAIGGRPSNRRS